MSSPRFKKCSHTRPFVVVGLVFAVTFLRAQPPAASPPLTLAQAVDLSQKNYPSIRVSQEQVNAAAAGIQLARTAYLPRVDAVAQINRATRNNIFGMLLPQPFIPPMSGPVLGSNNFGTAFGSAVGTLVTWEPFDFGLRAANVGIANATRAQSAATARRTQFDVAVATADAYLTVVAAQLTVRAAQASVDRADTILKSTSAEVTGELRPGADRSRADAELAAARTQLIQAQEAVDIALATLAQFTGPALPPSSAEEGKLTQLAPDQSPTPLNISVNPIVLEQQAAVEQARAQLRALERTYFPKFALQAAAYARGTGALTNGDRLGGLNGLAPSVQNYGLGFTVTFPVLDLPAIHAREAAQSATIRAQSARSDQIALDLRTQWNRAVAALNGARRIAANTPIEVSSAQTALQQASARYQAGQGNIDAVAEAQRLLTQAEIDDVLARLTVWRGLLGIATAAGDITPFLSEAAP